MLAAVLCSLVAVAASIPIELSGSAIDQWKIDAEGCGKRNAPYTRDAEHYVVGGSEASPYTYPFICALYYGTSQICGGSLIRNLAGNYWFVTAAHCVDSGAVSQYSIRCGMHDLRASSQPFEFKPAIQARIVHESYSSSTIKNDIALFRLSQTGFPRERISAVCIPTQDYREGENATVLGWGTLREGGSSSSLLQVASKPVVSDTTCRTAYGSSFDANTMMCAGVYPTGGIDACQGDSGGPLVAERNGELQLIGVVSWGYGCARPYYPGVYSDVLRLKTWLNSKINA